MQIQFQGILKTERRQQGQMYLLPAEISAHLENRRRQQRQQYLLAAKGNNSKVNCTCCPLKFSAS